MSGILLKQLGTGAALLALGGCAYVTPYPSAFPTTERSGACATAVTHPGNTTNIYNCLVQRGREWDDRGVAIRRQSGFVGQASIPLAIAGLGLSAAKDTSDFVPISSGVSSAALAHTGAYARPTQAEVYELATVSYRCLISSVAEWNGGGKARVNDAHAELATRNAAALRAVRAANLLDASARQDIEAELTAQMDQANRTLNRVDGAVGTALLRRSDEIDAAVIRAIRDRLPDPQTVAASVSSGGAPAASTPTVGTGPAQNGAVKMAGVPLTPAERAAAQRAAVDVLVIEANKAAEEFDVAIADYTAHSGSVGTSCTFNPSLLPTLSATPSTVTLDSTGKGFFIVRNGVPPYGHLPLPTGVTLTPTPLGGNAMRFEVTGPAGPSKIYIIDASPGGAVVEVTLAKAATPPP